MPPTDTTTALTLLREGELTVQGRLVDASNATLFCAVRLGDREESCVYKPVAGERPLWDFPAGSDAGNLACREVAAYAVSEAIGWDIVPPTVWRDGPAGPGMCQLWIDVDPEVDLATLAGSNHPDLRRMAVFDAVVNNADRKGGHLLPTPSGHVYGVDHGVCFHVEDKLRTLLWRWRGRPLPGQALAVLDRLDADLDPAGGLTAALVPLLSEVEIAATRARVRRLLATRRYPHPSEDRPAIPWPPF